MLRKDLHYFTIGFIISSLVVFLLVRQIMNEASDPIEDFASFATLSNIVFSLHMWVLFMSAWIFKGTHNRNLLLIWAIGHVLNLAIYYQLFDFFLLQWRNIYALNFVSAISLMVLYALIVRRRTLSLILNKLFRRELFKFDIKTKFEVYLVEFIKAFLAFEILYAHLISAYAIALGVGHSDSLSDSIRHHNHPDIFEWYFNALAFFTIYLTLLLLRNAMKDRVEPDKASCKLTVDEKLLLIKRMNKRF